MMKSIFTLFVVLHIPIFSFAQQGDNDPIDQEFKLSENWQEEKVDFSHFMYGFELGMSKSTQVVRGRDNSVVNHDGEGYSFKFIADYEFGNGFGLRGGLGYEQFLLKGAELYSSPLKIGETKIGFLGTEVLLKYQNMITAQLEFFMQGGLGVLFPVQVRSDSVFEDSINRTYVYIIGAGFVFPMDAWELVLALNYREFPGSEVKTKTYFFNVGFLFS